MDTKTLTQRLTEDFRATTEGGSASKFMAEMKALTPADKQWFCDQYNKEGKPTVMTKEQLPAV